MNIEVVMVVDKKEIYWLPCLADSVNDSLLGVKMFNQKAEKLNAIVIDESLNKIVKQLLHLLRVLFCHRACPFSSLLVKLARPSFYSDRR